MELREKYLWYTKHIDELIKDAREAARPIDEDNVFQRLLNWHSICLEWFHLESIASYEAKKAAEILEKVLIPQAREKLREDLEKREGKKPSEARLDASESLNPMVVEGSRRVKDLEFIAALFRDTRFALQNMKLDSVNARQCIELKANFQRE